MDTRQKYLTKLSLWRVSVQHRMTLESVQVLAFGDSPIEAMEHVYTVFPKAFFETLDFHICKNRKSVFVAPYHFPEDIL